MCNDYLDFVLLTLRSQGLWLGLELLLVYLMGDLELDVKGSSSASARIPRYINSRL
jgi:hypothetical protein